MFNITFWSVLKFQVGFYRLISQKVEKDFNKVFDTSTMLNHFTTLQEKHRNYRKNTNSIQQVDSVLMKIDIQ